MTTRASSHVSKGLRPATALVQSPIRPPQPPSVACSLHAYSYNQQSARSIKTMNAKNTKKITAS